MTWPDAAILAIGGAPRTTQAPRGRSGSGHCTKFTLVFKGSLESRHSNSIFTAWLRLRGVQGLLLCGIIPKSNQTRFLMGATGELNDEFLLRKEVRTKSARLLAMDLSQ